MTQTGLKAGWIKDPACGGLDKSGLTAPGLVKMMTFKGGKAKLFNAKIPFYCSLSFYGFYWREKSQPELYAFYCGPAS